MEFNQEINNENDQENEKDEEQNENENNEEISIKQWFQDNLRILVSIFVVIVIAVGIYSYSNRSPQDLATSKDQTDQSNPATTDTSAKDTGNSKSTTATTTGDKSATTDKTNKAETPDKNVSSTTTSQETEQSFIETAGKGDSLTKLARKALADYLEKNADSTLTPEHKIYIEDYLRKNVTQKGGVHIGASVEFSKSLIGDAIGNAKNLSAGQLKNLHKYALRVPSLT
jgi:predicted negative regulator of RcsB-dependent stress response